MHAIITVTIFKLYVLTFIPTVNNLNAQTYLLKVYNSIHIYFK